MRRSIGVFGHLVLVLLVVLASGCSTQQSQADADWRSQVSAYLVKSGEIDERISKAMAAVRDSDTLPADEQAEKHSLEVATGSLDTLKKAYADQAALQPPTGLEDYHQLILRADALDRDSVEMLVETLPDISKKGHMNGAKIQQYMSGFAEAALASEAASKELDAFKEKNKDRLAT